MLRLFFLLLAMPATISHALSMTTPNDPAYENQPKHWNSGHLMTMNAVGSEISGAFSNSNGISFGLEAGGGLTASYTVPSVPAQSAFVFSNSNGVTFGTNGSTVTASVKTDYQTSGAYLTTAMQSNAVTLSNINVSAGATSANLSAITFSNSNGVSFGLTNSVITATVATNYQPQGAYLTTAALSQDSSKYAGTNGSIVGGSFTLNTSGATISLPAYLTTAMQSNAATISNINVSAGSTSTNASAFTFSNANGVSFGIGTGASAGVVTGSIAGAIVNSLFAGGVSNLGNTAGSTKLASLQMVLVGAGGISLSQSLDILSNSATVTILGGANPVFSAGANSASLGSLIFSNSNGVSFGLNGSTITASAAAGSTLSQYMPWPFPVTGSAVGSNNPTPWTANEFNLPFPLAVSAIQFFNSVNVGVPGATSQASSGSLQHSYSVQALLARRVDYNNNSTQMTYVTSGSWGISATMSWTSTAQTISVNWVTDSTGGTSNFSTTSNAANWSNFFTGVKMFQVPLVATLTPGEYIYMSRRSSTTGTLGSNVTALSYSVLNFANAQTKAYGTITSSGGLPGEGLFMNGILNGSIGSANVVTNNTMAVSNIASLDFPGPVIFMGATRSG